ncbi:MAG: gephyrin-like molybdotransferase Glp [Gemmatimonadota bacterium]
MRPASGEGGRPPAGAHGSARFAEADWLSYPEALAVVLERCDRLASEQVSLEDALGRALAEEVRSPVDHPPWDNSAMDGFAVRAADVAGASRERPVTLPISGEVPAGSFPAGPLAPGAAVRVMTGAPVPPGTTGVIRVEHTDGGRNGEVRVYDDADAERHIRRAGEDIRAGDSLLNAGDELTPGAVAGLALAGRRRIAVVRRPRVAVLATGDELADFEAYPEVLAGRKIMNTNSYALAAQLRSAGADPLLLGIARDDPADLRRRIEASAGWDALLSVAGVSVGEHDHVKETLESLGMERLFWRIRMRPGSALVFGLLGDRPFWGLPGNPASAMVTFEALARPAIRRLGGHSRVHRRRVRAILGERIASSQEITHFFRVRLEESVDGPPVARLTGAQGSGRLRSMLAADGLLAVPEGVEALEEGEEVDVIPLRE